MGLEYRPTKKSCPAEPKRFNRLRALDQEHTCLDHVSKENSEGKFSMRKFQFIQLDVFTNQPFAGNPLAVFPEAEGLDDDQMMKIAREMNLSETVFVLPGSQQQTANSKRKRVNSKQQTVNSRSQEATLKRLRIIRNPQPAIRNRLCGVCASSRQRARSLSQVIRLPAPGMLWREKESFLFPKAAAAGRVFFMKWGSVCCRLISSSKTASRCRL